MGWGDAAGLVEQLSYRVAAAGRSARAKRPGCVRDAVDAAATGVDRLDGKRVVIYEFAARELAFGDWQILK